MKSKLLQRPPRQKAQAMIEFALVFPLLVFVLYGVLEFGRMLFIYTSVVNASREASRFGSSVGNVGSFRFMDCNGILAAAQRNAILNAITAGNISIFYDRGPGTAAYATCASVNERDVRLGDRINVTVTIPYSPLMPIDFASFPISSTAARTIIRNVEISGSVVGDGTPTVTFSASELPEPRDEGSGTVILGVRLNIATTNTVVVPLILSGAATYNVDYTINPSSLTVSLAPGETSANVIITLIDDTLDEYNESLVITMGTPVNANRGSPSEFRMVIADNDDPPQLFFQNAASSGPEATSVSIAVVLSEVSGKDVTFNYDFIEASSQATIPADFSIGPGSPVTIPAGSAGVNLVAVLRRDNLYEYNEIANFTLLSVAVDAIDPGTPTATIDTSRDDHTLTIINIDPPPVVAWELPTSVASEALRQVVLALRLNQVSAIDVQITLRVDPASTARSPNDYRILNGLNYTIPAGAVEVEVPIQLVEGDGFEPNETLILEITSVIDGTRGNPFVHTLTITETLTPPTVQFTSAGQSVDESGVPLPARVALSSAWNADIVISFSVAGTAQSGVDYTLLTASPLVIRAGRLSADIRLTLEDDALDEDDETVILTITSVTSPAATGSPAAHTITILDNDEAPTISFVMAASSYEEGSGNVSVQVVLSAVSAKQISVNFSTGGTAVAGTDYTLATASPLVFTPGSSSRTINLNIPDDELYTGLREIVFTLSGAVNATPVEPQVHTLVIIENEVCPTMTSLTFNNDQISAIVALPTGATTVTLQSMTVTFYTAGGQKLQDIYLGTGGSSLIFSGNLGTSPVTFSQSGSPAWRSGGDRTLVGGEGKVLLLTFNKSIDASTRSLYSILIQWSNGCTARKP
jgi:Flp pilus assembly protein TadG